MDPLRLPASAPRPTTTSAGPAEAPATAPIDSAGGSASGEAHLRAHLPARGLRHLPTETLQNVMRRLPPGSLANLARTSREMNAKAKPEVQARKVLADARIVNTLPRLKQLLGLVPLRRSRGWAPQVKANEVSNTVRARALVVLAGRVSQLPAAQREEGRRVVLETAAADGDHRLVPEDVLTAILDKAAGPFHAALTLIQRFGVNAEDAADASGYADLSPIMRHLFSRDDLGKAVADGPAAREVGEGRRPVEQVAAEYRLDGDARARLEQRAASGPAREPERG